MRMKTYLAKKSEVSTDWYCVDASGQILGRLATRIAKILMGKHKPTYTPHMDCGDYVVVINAEKVRLTGKKAQTKTYQRYSYHPGGRKVIPYQTMLERHPERILGEAVRRMLPKNKLARQMLSKLKIYAGEEHPHTAQQPKPLELS